MKATIYLPDELADQLVEARNNINMSAVCQSALREEITRMNTITEHDKAMTRVEFDAYESHGGAVSFVGKELASAEEYGRTAYLTEGHRIAITIADLGVLEVYENFDDLSLQVATDDRFLAEIAEALGEKHVIKLDI